MAVIIEPNLDLLYAAMNGSLRGVKAALKAGADIDFDIKNSETFSPGTALYIASYKGHVDIVKLLLRKGASVSKRTRSSFGPLHGAATEGKTEVVDLLVQHGATLDIRDGFQNTPLMRACNYNHVDTVRRLIELGARPDLTGGQLQGMRYYKPGTEIGKGENEESLKLVEEARKSKLLRCCNPTCGKPGYRYYKPGTEIGKGENEESLKLVEEARKSKLLRCCNPTCGKPGYSSRDKIAHKVTRQLAASVQPQTAHAQGVDNSGSNKMDATDANIYLFDAVSNGSLRGVEAALKAGADIDCKYARCEDSRPATLLFHASCMGDVDTARLLLCKGASLVKRSDRSAFAPLHAAAINVSLCSSLLLASSIASTADQFLPDLNLPPPLLCYLQDVANSKHTSNPIKRIDTLVARQQTKLSNSLVTCLVLSHSLSYINQPNCPTVLLPGWCCPTTRRTSTNQTVQQPCYLPSAVPQPIVHQRTKLSNSPVTCLVLSHSLSYINEPNCPTVLLLAWCCPTTCRTSTNKTVQQSCYLPGAVPQPVVHQQTKLSNSLVTCLVLSHSLSYINEQNYPTVLLLAWCCPTACRTSTNQTVQQSCYLPGAVPQPVVRQQTKLSNSLVTCLVLSHSLSHINKQNCPTVLLLAWCRPTACRTSTNQTVQQSCYLLGVVPQPVVHQQTKLFNSLVTCLVLSHSLSYINEPNCPTVLLLAWCCPTACRTSTNQTAQQSCYLPGVVPQPVVHQQTKLSNSPVTCLVLSHSLSYTSTNQNCPTVLLLAWCRPTACRTSTNQTVQQSCYLPGVVPQPVVHQQTKLSNSPVTCLVLSHNPSSIHKQNYPIVLLLTWGCPTTCRMTTTNKTVQQSCYLPGVVQQPVA
uniref:Uncharacterized protein n=1 Tax=Branchiostoma floridae TaxID=7739 RepID=C3ZSW6_BRAFL|eukprot:XP_002588300.1 hypothetical protein BRAFLDRAFT_122883 [Branchiostoma floridae]